MSKFGILIIAFLFVGPSALAQEEPAFDSKPHSGYEIQVGEFFERFFKFSVLLDAAGKPSRIVFQNANIYEFHRDFLATQPEFKGMTAEKIDDLTYKGKPERKALIGVLRTYINDEGVFYKRFSLLMDETPKAEDIIAVHNLVEKATADVEIITSLGQVEFEPSKSQVPGMSAINQALAKARVPIAPEPESMLMRPYTNAWNFGRIEWVGSQDELNAKIASGQIGPQTILVTDQVLREFPPVAGVISSQLMTPVSHAVLLAQMYEAPVIYHRDAVQIFKPLVGHTLLLQSQISAGLYEWNNRADYIVDPAKETLQKLALFKEKPRLAFKLDMTQTAVRSARELNLDSVAAYGGKASQMGLLMQDIPGSTVSEAAAIPISAFKNFMAKARASNGQTLQDFVLESLNQIPVGQENSAQASKILKTIRKEIKDAKIPDEVYKPIRQSLERLFPGQSVRLKLRSSSNVEDGAEFNGAGLYDSQGAWLNGSPDGSDDLAKTLKQVWSSLYTDRGFLARRRFQVDETKAGMGILVHAPFKNEQANGVISFHLDESATYNKYAEIVTQPGEEALVTHSEGEVPAEVIRISDGQVKLIQAYQSQVLGSKMVLRTKQYQELEQLIEKLAKRYKSMNGRVDIEAEWKVVGDKVYLKQVRRIPNPQQRTLPDSSKYVFIAAKETPFRPPRSNETSDAFAALWMPRDIHVKMQGGTEAEIKNNKFKISEVNFKSEGNRYTIANPKVRYQEELYGEMKVAKLIVEIPIPLSPSLKMIINLPDGSKTGPEFFKSILFESDDPTAKSRSQVIKFDSGADAVPFGEILEPYDDDRVEGKDSFKLSVRGKHPVTVINEKVKNVGEAQARWLKIGQATIYGILDRPLVIPYEALGYGASHHDGLETYVYDLFGDKQLTAQEKAILTAKGRYLHMDTSADATSSGDALLIKDSGESIKLGRWTQSKETTRPKQQPIMFPGKIFAPQMCEKIYK